MKRGNNPNPQRRTTMATTMSPARAETLEIARAAGASLEVLEAIRAAKRVARRDSIRLPVHHLETLSRGTGWCRHGRGPTAIWGEREDGGYRVGTPGVWIVHGSDGFRRARDETWTVEHIQVGDATWTIAS
jgi:hypothetical protein